MSPRNLLAPTFSRTRLGSGPGLLLAHGAGSSLAGTYGPVLEALAARHTVVGIDYPGSGDTPRSTAPLSVDDLADQLIAAADAEGLDRFAVSGFSLGGPVAIRAAARHPERVTALVLTAAFPHRDNRLALASSVWSKIAASGDRELLAEFQLMMALGTQALESMPAEQLRQTLGYVAATAADGSSEQTDLVGQVDVRGDLAGIKVPTLVISTTDDRLTSTALHRHLAETIPGAQLADIATGHLPMLERTEEWLQLISDFLGKHNA
ncbi:alpha/beta hydrolase [Streptomyces violarus]|uniref:Pimeloyl-ACP methyl ester carboxylesterase n=1 Tax=Streptomyces violarus TaxID=67380 RepID=A0A7W4ZUR7_9ACTN|nr:alpha/beta fold hydrolase [Streptomyces violarus]MBB3078928.1 pimeloyl-ACP methyl ester carboxylesterase [Streptomyces violarus]GHD07921.1 alpha/beta hydrolase [Streptomyces violarus]